MGFLSLLPTIRIFGSDSAPASPAESSPMERTRSQWGDKDSKGRQSGDGRGDENTEVESDEEGVAQDPLSQEILRRATTLTQSPTHTSAHLSSGPTLSTQGSHNPLEDEASRRAAVVGPGQMGYGGGGGSAAASGAPASGYGHGYGAAGSGGGVGPGGQAKQHKDAGLLSKIRNTGARPTQEDEKDASAEYMNRDEGWNASVFGFVPDAPIPPRYVHVRRHRKHKREFNRLFLAQELQTHGRIARGDLLDLSEKTQLPAGKLESAVWSMRFSKDGRYLATAGQDGVIRVWQVISRPREREDDEDADEPGRSGPRGRTRAGAAVGPPALRSQSRSRSRSRFRSRSRMRTKAYAPVFRSQPVREFVGHTMDVLDLSWSKNNFLLSSSMDKTVRLWHIDRPECLATFEHNDFVTSIQFHPRDDRFFLSGSLDSKLRLWSIPDHVVAYERDVPDLLTSVAFSPDGLISIAGCFRGQCLFYETQGLAFKNKIHVRSSRGRNSKGSKITGLEAITLPPSLRYARTTPFDSDVKLLVSTNDSRVRLYNMHDQSLDMKFKGLENEQSQISASFSDDMHYVISGSEDERTYIWDARAAITGGSDRSKKDMQEYEYFHSNRAPVTAAIFAPTLTRKILAASCDPLYELCDPAPVHLNPSGHATQEPVIDPETGFPKLRPDTARSRHTSGHIIVTADNTGTIKIFRQDCAWSQRRSLADSASQKKRLSTISGLSPTQSWHSIARRPTRTRSGSLTSGYFNGDASSMQSRPTSPG